MNRFSFVLGFLFAFSFFLSSALSQEVLKPEVKVFERVIVSAYTASKEECGKTDGITRSGLKVRRGIVACNFLPLGTKVRIPSLFGNKIFVVADRMAKRNKYNIDIYVTDRKYALNVIEKRRRTIEVVG